jgi:hypothetical protein
MLRCGFANRKLLATGLPVLLAAAAIWGGYRQANEVRGAPVTAFLPPQPDGYAALLAVAARLRPEGGRRLLFSKHFPLADQRRAVRANQGALRDARRALDLPFLAPPDPDGRQRFTDYTRLSRLGGGFPAASRVGAADWRWRRSASVALVAMRMGALLPRGASTCRGLTGLRLLSEGSDALARAFPHLAPDQRRRLRHQLAAVLARWPELADGVRVDRQQARWELVALFTALRDTGPLSAARGWNWHKQAGERTARWFMRGMGIEVDTEEPRPAIEWEDLVFVFTPKRPALERIDRQYERLEQVVRAPAGTFPFPPPLRDPVGRLVGPDPAYYRSLDAAWRAGRDRVTALARGGPARSEGAAVGAGTGRRSGSTRRAAGRRPQNHPPGGGSRGVRP